MKLMTYRAKTIAGLAILILVPIAMSVLWGQVTEQPYVAGQSSSTADLDPSFSFFP